MALFSTSETISGNLIFDAHESPRMSESRGTLSGSQSLGHAFHRSRPEAEMEKPLLPKDGESQKNRTVSGAEHNIPKTIMNMMQDSSAKCLAATPSASAS
jgi:hypothetical protein